MSNISSEARPGVSEGRSHNSPGFQPGEQKATLENKSCKDDTQDADELIAYTKGLNTHYVVLIITISNVNFVFKVRYISLDMPLVHYSVEGVP